MGAWKIIGCCALGAVAAIGVVVLLPVAGPVLAITGTGAIIAGASGATVGGIAAAAHDAATEVPASAGQPRETEEAGAKAAERARKLDVALRDALAKIEEEYARHALIVTAHAVGVAIHTADGPVSTETCRQLREFAGGVTHPNLPDHVKQQLDEIERHPPSLDIVWARAQRHDPAHRRLLDEAVQTLCESQSQDAPSPRCAAFQTEWMRRSQGASAKEASNA